MVDRMKMQREHRVPLSGRDGRSGAGTPDSLQEERLESLFERTGRCVALHSLEQLAVPANDQAGWNRMDPVALHHAAIDIAQRGVADAEFLQVPPRRARILVTHPEHDEAVGGMPLVQPLQLRQLPSAGFAP